MCRVVKKVAERTVTEIKLFCSLESNRPFTKSSDAFSKLEEQYKISLLYLRNENHLSTRALRSTNTIRDPFGNFRSISHDECTDDMIMSQLMCKGIRLNDPKQLALLHPRDPQDTELHVISGILAYFHFASTRVVDIMPMIFEVVFAQGIANELWKGLASALKLVDDSAAGENCVRYARDDDQIHEKRIKLTEDQKVLLEALDVLRTS